MNVDIRPRAERQIRAAAQWWLTNRDKAPDAFDSEIARAIALLRSSPSVGSFVRTRSRPARRIILHRIRYYLYYRIHRDRVEVIALWHTSRRPPVL